jgi:hypothetical protein
MLNRFVVEWLLKAGRLGEQARCAAGRSRTVAECLFAYLGFGPYHGQCKYAFAGFASLPGFQNKRGCTANLPGNRAVVSEQLRSRRRRLAD